jgi:hypothetical protein
MMIRAFLPSLALIALLALAACSPTPLVATPQPAEPTPTPVIASEEAAAQLLYDLVSEDRSAAEEAYSQILLAEDPRFIAAYIELMRITMIGFNTKLTFSEIVQALESLSGQSFDNDWFAWIEWYGATDLAPPPGFTGWKGELLSQIDPGFGEFLRDGLPSEIRVEEIVWGGVRVDGIPALDNAEMIPALEAEYLAPDEPVFGVSINGDNRAYPLRILDWHEMANDVVGGVPISLAYCTLCGAGIGFNGQIEDGRTFTFGSSGFLYRSNKLMYDRQTRTLWNQLTGEPVLGELVGSDIRLDLLPVVVTTWADWQDQHPDTVVLSLETGFARTYEPGAAYGDYFSYYDTMFPVWQRSDLLAAKDRVYALQLEGIPVAYPVDRLVEEVVANHQVGETPLVVLAMRGGILVDGYSLRVGQVRYDAGAEVRAYAREGYEFSPAGDLAQLQDQFGGAWQITEQALVGPQGSRLERLNGHLAYWFGWYAFFPRTEVYGQTP